MKSYQYILTATTLLAASTNIAFADFDPFVEFTLMGGIANVDAEDTSLVILESDETDKLVQTNDENWKSWTGQLGLGYVMPFLSDVETGGLQWFPMITPQINFYVLGNADIEGDVWRFESPDWNQGTYDLEFDSVRAMFDLALTVVSIEQFSIYALGGLGISSNKTTFAAMSNPDVNCPIADMNFDDQNSSSFVYEFGGGVTFAATDRLAISLEYLFTHFDDVELGAGNVERFETDVTDMDINTQAVLLGIRLALGS